jgi:hypothetical protein
MSTAAARRVAGSILRWGHFRPSRTEAYVRCRNRHEVHVEFVAWAKDGEVHKALLNALANHIREDCTT